MSSSPIIGHVIKSKNRDFANHLYSPILLTPLKPGQTGDILWYREARHALTRPKWFKPRPHARMVKK